MESPVPALTFHVVDQPMHAITVGLYRHSYSIAVIILTVEKHNMSFCGGGEQMERWERDGGGERERERERERNKAYLSFILI